MGSIIGYIVSALCGGLAGSLLTTIVTYYRNKLQKMECYYAEDDILSKIPQKGEDNEVRQNLHCKRYVLKNTTNKDISEFKVIFQFDAESVVTECYSQSKEGYDKHKIKASVTDKNSAVAKIRNFNRNDEITFTIKIANVTRNDYYVRESDCLGFKIVCKDIRTDTKKSKSKQSNQVLVQKH